MQRMAGLDLLRATAILAVLCTHAWVAGGMGPGFGWIEQYGWMGVDLFFVLSGFLIGRPLLSHWQESRSIDLKAFYRQRAYRIVPAYLVVLALYAWWPGFREQPALAPLWQFLSFSMNLLVDQRVPHAFSSAWSLCVEEQFYLLLPLLLLWLAPRATPRRVAGCLLGLLLAGMLWRGVAWWHSALPGEAGHWQMQGLRYMEQIYYPTYARLDGLLAGFALALLSVYRPVLWQRLLRQSHRWLVAAVAVILVAAWVFEDILSFAACVVGFPLLALGLALLVLAAMPSDGLLGRCHSRIVRWIATVSYSLYLTHKAVLKLAWDHLPASAPHRGLVGFLCCALAALLAAALLHYLIERPFLWWRDRGRVGGAAAGIGVI